MLKKYNMHIFIAIVAVLTAYDLLNWDGISIVRKLVNLFAVLGVLHEIEEKYWPGGFHKLMLKKFEINADDFDVESANFAVFVFWMVYLALGYIFDNMVFFFLMTIVLSIFEAFIHTAGIKIHNLNKPYTPGMVTAWLMAIAAIYSVIRLNGIAAPIDYLIAIVLFVVSFAILASRIWSSAGITRKDMFEKIRQ